MTARLCAALLALATATAPSGLTASMVRPAEQTFLTFPEWYLVYSPAEFAEFTRDHAPDAFPFWGELGQLWGSYAAVPRATVGRYPTNIGYHVMILVIATSTTVEYGIRSAYETLVGRFFALTRRGCMTDEERFGAEAAQAYVDFIRVRPWYEFDFWSRFVGLWRTTSLLGPDLPRKWERKYALTTEYLVKAAYGWLIEKATHAAYDPAEDVTAVELDRLPADMRLLPTEPRIFSTTEGTWVKLPRYDAFKDVAVQLAQQGVQIKEIAGNRSTILLSVIGPVGFNPPGDTLFRQPILTRPGRERVAFTIPVPQLSNVLRILAAPGVQLEHIYDY